MVVAEHIQTCVTIPIKRGKNQSAADSFRLRRRCAHPLHSTLPRDIYTLLLTLPHIQPHVQPRLTYPFAPHILFGSATLLELLPLTTATWYSCCGSSGRRPPHGVAHLLNLLTLWAAPDVQHVDNQPSAPPPGLPELELVAPSCEGKAGRGKRRMQGE